MTDDFAIFPDDFDDGTIPLSTAVLNAKSQHNSYVKRENRDYSIARSMVKKCQMTDDVQGKPLNTQYLPAFVPAGVVRQPSPALDTSGVSNLLCGTTPEGGHLFEFSFDEGIFNGLTCRLATMNGAVTATFVASNYEDARKIDSHLPQLRQALEAKGLKIDKLAVEIN